MNATDKGTGCIHNSFASLFKLFHLLGTNPMGAYDNGLFRALVLPDTDSLSGQILNHLSIMYQGAISGDPSALVLCMLQSNFRSPLDAGTKRSEERRVGKECGY